MNLTESQPLLTVIVAVFNGAKTLQQCIDSVAHQTYENIELIIIDGGSQDGTVDLLKKNSEQISYWVSEPDRGIYNAWNKALAQATGDWICFLGADDYLWNADVMFKFAHSLNSVQPSMYVAYGQVMLLNDGGRNMYAVGEPWENINERFYQVMCIPHQGVFHRHALFEKVGDFDTSFRIAGDYELLLRELKKSKATFIPIIVSGMRQGGISNKPENTIKTLQEIRRAQKMHGFKFPGRIWTLAYIRSYIRTWAWKILGERCMARLLDTYRRAIGLPAYWTKL
ncbi:glycosyltransferase family 2 protein [Herminiimonas aquatilis]|uniref:Glycosyltransferase family 2 protein n=1 Tax=Herminiimonas aquatilis TaxID=345342 RepID=A0ABW2JAD4_9BURK